MSSHTRAVLIALLVTFLWSTSWIFIKFGLRDIPPLAFAGLRFGLAFVCLLPLLILGNKSGQSLAALGPRQWGQFFLLGVFIAIIQGSQFLSLAYLPAMTVSLVLNFSSIVVAILGIAFLGERPTLLQWSGVLINLCGIFIYFFPVHLPAQEPLGLGVAIAGMLANSIFSILGRSLNSSPGSNPLVVTTTSIGFGAILLLMPVVAFQGLALPSPLGWSIIAWLAVINTALAFVLWNRSLKVLTAIESSVINNTMLVQIALLAWVFLGERLTLQQMAGMAFAAIGAALVQLRK